MARVPGFTCRYDDSNTTLENAGTRGVPWRIAQAAVDEELGQVIEDNRDSGELDPAVDDSRAENDGESDPTLCMLSPEQVAVVDSLLEDCKEVGFEDACKMDDTARAVQDWLNGRKTAAEVAETAGDEAYDRTADALRKLVPAPPPGP